MTKTQAVDLSQFNGIAIENDGEELELTFKGEKTGAVLIVVGENADVVKQYVKKTFKEQARKDHFAGKKGRELELMDSRIDSLDVAQIDAALARVIGWKNVNGEFDQEKLRTVLQNNPNWIEDIISLSKSLGK